MSAESMKQVISRAVIEPEYRQLLFNQPAQALANYALSPDEQVALTGLTPEAFDGLVGSLEDRISRVSFGFQGPNGPIGPTGQG
jgi:hypothetical protein